MNDPNRNKLYKNVFHSTYWPHRTLALKFAYRHNKNCSLANSQALKTTRLTRKRRQPPKATLTETRTIQINTTTQSRQILKLHTSTSLTILTLTSTSALSFLFTATWAVYLDLWWLKSFCLDLFGSNCNSITVKNVL